ncbi:UNVERIFIED_CONTAM: hypothetical protein GTU68_059541, partial [Idotea baltica]|nr:hypothetical protein [Idotea baltica]
MNTHNFYAGPAILPKQVFLKSADAVLNFNNSGLSILEISHRSKGFVDVMEKTNAMIKELLSIPDGYEVLFLTGGASSQFYMASMNLLNDDDRAAFVDTGTWSTKAIKEAVHFGQIDVIASSKDSGYTSIPSIDTATKDYKFVHITTNNTIFGTQFDTMPTVDAPLIGDMSSDIFSRPIDISKFDLIYAGAQKNLGPAGVTLVIVKKDVLGRVTRKIPTMLDYNTHISKGSSFNTPPVFPIYVSMLSLEWLKENGGVLAAEKRNNEKASLLYKAIDDNPLFFTPVHGDDRSKMNVVFKLHDNNYEAAFLEAAEAAQCVGVKGHRSVGGFRASIYNAM